MKYIFLENKVKVVIPQKFIESQIVDTNENLEFAKLEKSWFTKKKTASYKAYIFDLNSSSDIVNVTNTLSREFVDIEGLTPINERKVLINNNKKAGVQEFSDGKTYICVFCAKYTEDKYLFFRFQCPEKQKSKYIDGLNESIKTLFVQ